MEDKTLTAAEVVNELRRGARVYETFKEGEQIALFILDQERIKKGLDKDVNELTKLKEELESQFDAIEKKFDEKQVAVEALKVTADEIQKQAEVVRADILLKARAEAQGIIDAGVRTQQSAYEETKKYVAAKDVAEQAARGAQEALDAVNAELKSAKERVTRMFG